MFRDTALLLPLLSDLLLTRGTYTCPMSCEINRLLKALHFAYLTSSCLPALVIEADKMSTGWPISHQAPSEATNPSAA